MKINLNEYRLALTLIIKQEQKMIPPTDRDNEALGIFLDNQNILRSRGRLGKSPLSPNTIEPIYLQAHTLRHL